tara:strand:- start:7001 stop:7714 length:714 start_codon:yes stop_codon:yes gene_type:complete
MSEDSKTPPRIVNIEDIYEVIPKKTVQALSKNFLLDLTDIHGVNHWLRVLTNGLIIADAGEKVHRDVLIAFAFVHDAFRVTDDVDPLHGLRASDALLTYLSKNLNLDDHKIQLLAFACKYHSDGYNANNIDFDNYSEEVVVRNTTDANTIGACWDADRLDLLRVGVFPDEMYLTTNTAKESSIINICNQSALNDSVTKLAKEIRQDIIDHINNRKKEEVKTKERNEAIKKFFKKFRR